FEGTLRGARCRRVGSGLSRPATPAGSTRRSFLSCRRCLTRRGLLPPQKLLSQHESSSQRTNRHRDLRHICSLHLSSLIAFCARTPPRPQSTQRHNSTQQVNLSLIDAQKREPPAHPFVAGRHRTTSLTGPLKDQLIPEALVVPFAVVVRD